MYRAEVQSKYFNDQKVSGNLSYWNLVLATNLHKKVHIMSFLVPTLYMGCRPGGIISQLVGTKNSEFNLGFFG